MKTENHQAVKNDSLYDSFTFNGEKQKVVVKKPKGIRKPRAPYFHKSYKCKSCEIIFDKKEDKVLHIQQVHVALSSFKCPKCDAVYKSRNGKIKDIF